MNGEIVNLKRARKRMARTERERDAAQNRILFSRSGEKRRAAETQRLAQERSLDGHRRDRTDDGET